MSKLVVLNIPAHGHVNPTLPVVQELARRGEQVVYYNTEEFRPQIEATGASFRAYPASVLTSTAIATALHEGLLVRVTELLLKATEALLPFVLEELRRERPGQILFDSTVLWGRMAASALEIPAVALITTFVFDEGTAGISFRELLGLLRQTLPRVPGLLQRRARLVRTYPNAYPKGQPLFPMRGELNLVFTARGLQPNSKLIDESFRFVGPSINAETRGDQTFDLPTERPLIYLSLGTIHTAHEAFYRQCFAAFGDYPAHFLFSVGRGVNIGALGSIPANFTLRQSVPQLQVLQQSAVFITHGGINSMHEGLYYGVPLILIPQQFEQLLNARCAEAHGAGLVLDAPLRGKSLTAIALRNALQRVMSEASFRAAAQSVQMMLRATGGYSEAANAIQAASA